jgi:hypothetical protein
MIGLSKSVGFVLSLIFSWFFLDFCPRSKKPASVDRRRALGISRSLWPFTSGHSSPPAWMFHDDGDDRDGGGSASD